MNDDDELELRMSLLMRCACHLEHTFADPRHPAFQLSTRLLDAHIYVLRRNVLDLLATRDPRDLGSIREQIVPWLVKGGWQKGLARKWSPSGLSIVLFAHMSLESLA